MDQEDRDEVVETFKQAVDAKKGRARMYSVQAVVKYFEYKEDSVSYVKSKQIVSDLGDPDIDKNLTRMIGDAIKWLTNNPEEHPLDIEKFAYNSAQTWRVEVEDID